MNVLEHAASGKSEPGRASKPGLACEPSRASKLRFACNILDVIGCIM